MLQVTAEGVTRAVADDRPQKRAPEACHSIVARSDDREKIRTMPAGAALVIGENPQLQYGVQVMACVQLLDRDRVRHARRILTQRMNRDLVDADRRLEAEVDDRPVEELISTGQPVRG
jgi:hypothetical protein